MKNKKGVAEAAVTVLVPLIMFLGTGIYKMFNTQKGIPAYQAEHAKIKDLQKVMCNGINPSPDELKTCIEVLKVSIPDN